jgi:hypothetical protein
VGLVGDGVEAVRLRGLDDHTDTSRLGGRRLSVDRRGEVPEGKAPFYEAPVFNEYAGYVSVL